MAKKKTTKRTTNRLSAADRQALADDTQIDLATPPESNGDGIVSEDKAKAALIAARQAKEKACSQAIQAVLAKYNCIMDVAMVVTPTQNIPQITVRVKD